MKLKLPLQGQHCRAMLYFTFQIGEVRKVEDSRRVSLRLDLFQTSGALDSYVMSSWMCDFKEDGKSICFFVDSDEKGKLRHPDTASASSAVAWLLHKTLPRKYQQNHSLSSLTASLKIFSHDGSQYVHKLVSGEWISNQVNGMRVCPYLCPSLAQLPHTVKCLLLEKTEK